MIAALWLLAVQGVLGAFDTVWYHEWRARLPWRAEARRELAQHAARDFLYAIIFATLPCIEWRGAWAHAFVAILGAEIVITLTDFVIETYDRGVEAGERVTHAVMGICYGAMLALLIPTLARWAMRPTGFALSRMGVPATLRVVMTVMAVGVFLSGVRDLVAAMANSGKASL
jgi:hypothetical protein